MITSSNRLSDLPTRLTKVGDPVPQSFCTCCGQLLQTISCREFAEVFDKVVQKLGFRAMGFVATLAGGCW